MPELLQRVTMANTVPGQKVKIIGYKSWWTVFEKSDKTTTLKKGNQLREIDNNSVVLQELFANLDHASKKRINNEMEGVRVPKKTRKFK